MQSCGAAERSARTKLANSKFFSILMFTVHGVIFLIYLGVLAFYLREADAAFENGVFQFYLGGVYLGLMLASALGNSFVVAQVEIAFGVFAIVFSVWGTSRDWYTQREIFVSSMNTLWTVGLLISLVASVIHYIALQEYRAVLKAKYGTSSAEKIVFGELQVDQSRARREQGESLQQLLADERAQDDFGFIGNAVDKTAHGVFNVIRTGRARQV